MKETSADRFSVIADFILPLLAVLCVSDRMFRSSQEGLLPDCGSDVLPCRRRGSCAEQRLLLRSGGEIRLFFLNFLYSLRPDASRGIQHPAGTPTGGRVGGQIRIEAD